MARSMLSFGTEVFFAFCTASTRVGLPERSAPPIFAATSMFLMSLANDFARRCVDDGLLVLGRRPLGMPGHASPESLSVRVRRVPPTDHSKPARPAGPSAGGAPARRRVGRDRQARIFWRVRRLRFVVIGLYLALPISLAKGLPTPCPSPVSSRRRRRPRRAGRRRRRARRRPRRARRPAPGPTRRSPTAAAARRPRRTGMPSTARSSSARVTSTIHASYPKRRRAPLDASLQRGAGIRASSLSKRTLPLASTVRTPSNPSVRTRRGARPTSR